MIFMFAAEAGPSGGMHGRQRAAWWRKARSTWQRRHIERGSTAPEDVDGYSRSGRLDRERPISVEEEAAELEVVPGREGISLQAFLVTGECRSGRSILGAECRLCLERNGVFEEREEADNQGSDGYGRVCGIYRLSCLRGWAA